MLGWVFGFVGAIGLTGAVALFFLGPAAVLVFIQAALAVFSRMWATRPGMALMVALTTGAGGYLAGRNDGVVDTKAKWAAANAIAAEKARQKDAEITATAEATDARDTVAEVSDDKANQESRDAYIAELEKRLEGSKAVCRVDDDGDVRRLLDIR